MITTGYVAELMSDYQSSHGAPEQPTHVLSPYLVKEDGPGRLWKLAYHKRPAEAQHCFLLNLPMA